LVETALLVLFLVLWSHGVVMHLDRPTSSDFVSFYAAGKLALAGTPALAYDQAAHLLAEQQATVPGAIYQYFFYPPVYLLLCAPLALLPYYVAYAVFEAGTLALFALVMRAVLRERGYGWLAPRLAFPAVWWTLGQGQNAFLTAALLGLFTLLIDTQPVRAGILLGALCYKPHLGLLALLAGRRWAARRPPLVSGGALSAAQSNEAGRAEAQQAQRGRFRDVVQRLDRHRQGIVSKRTGDARAYLCEVGDPECVHAGRQNYRQRIAADLRGVPRGLRVTDAVGTKTIIEGQIEIRAVE